MRVTLIKAIRRINQAADTKLTKEAAADLSKVLDSLLTIDTTLDETADTLSDNEPAKIKKNVKQIKE